MFLESDPDGEFSSSGSFTHFERIERLGACKNNSFSRIISWLPSHGHNKTGIFLSKAILNVPDLCLRVKMSIYYGD